MGFLPFFFRSCLSPSLQLTKYKIEILKFALIWHLTPYLRGSKTSVDYGEGPLLTQNLIIKLILWNYKKILSELLCQLKPKIPEKEPSHTSDDDCTLTVTAKNNLTRKSLKNCSICPKRIGSRAKRTRGINIAYN